MHSEGEQTIDPTCAYDCVVTSPSSIVCGTGTIVCCKGYSEGKHYWEFTVAQAGWYAFAGVATRDPGDDSEVLHGHTLSGMEAGYAICGWSQGPGTSPAFHAGIPTNDEYPLFQPGDRVGLLLDCESGTLDYHLNGKSVGTLQIANRMH